MGCQLAGFGLPSCPSHGVSPFYGGAASPPAPPGYLPLCQIYLHLPACLDLVLIVNCQPLLGYDTGLINPHHIRPQSTKDGSDHDGSDAALHITIRALLSAINKLSMSKGVSKTRSSSLVDSDRCAQPDALKTQGHATGTDGSNTSKRPSSCNMPSLTIGARRMVTSMGHGNSISLEGSSGVAAFTT